jgi:hypothetical protein
MRTPPVRHRTRFSRAVLGTTAVALGSVLMLSACSDDSGKKKDEIASLGDKKGASGSGAPKEAAAGAKGDMVKYAGCMREHGIDMPDPGADGSMMVQAMPADDGSGAEMNKMQVASDACSKWLPNGGVLTEKDKAEQREKSLKFARCMREHGVDMPDPDADGMGAMTLDSGGDQTKMDEATKACAEGGAGGAMTVTR